MFPKKDFKIPVYADSLSPDIFEGKTIEQISELTLWEGNKARDLDDLFRVSLESVSALNTVTIRIVGNLSKIRMIGAGMSRGKVLLEGDVGMHLGENMNGGEIKVVGNVDSWVGGAMKGGRIEVTGSAADYVGGPYRGSQDGMEGGEIVIHGDAGNEVGCSMSGGLIKISGRTGSFAGKDMREGIIWVEGDNAGRVGAGMKKGKIVIRGHVGSVLPTFTLEGVKSKVSIGAEKIDGPFYLFIGDVVEKGKGQLFISKAQNAYLSSYEKYL